MNRNKFCICFYNNFHCIFLLRLIHTQHWWVSVAQYYRSPWMCITKSSREVCLHPSCSDEDVNYFLCCDWLGSAHLAVFTHTRPLHFCRSPRAGPDVPRTMHFTSGSVSPLTPFNHMGHNFIPDLWEPLICYNVILLCAHILHWKSEANTASQHWLHWRTL